MNTLVLETLPGPLGDSVESPTLIVTDTEVPFVMHDIATIGTTYTLSFWIKSEGSISVCGASFASASKWTQHSVTFVAEDVDIRWTFGSVGTYYLYHAKLELGNLPTDWTPAPEDVNRNLKVGARNLLRNSENLIFDSYSFGEPMLDEIIAKQAEILAKQDSYIGTASEVSTGASGSNMNDILDGVIGVQESILTAQNNYIGGDAE